MDNVLFTCDNNTFPGCLALARQHGAGLEIQTFAFPNILDGDWRGLLAHYQEQLQGFTGELACHGAFFDLASGSPDKLVQAVARQRYLHNLEIAHALNAHWVVFHANYLPQVHSAAYRASWLRHQHPFWIELAARAYELGVTIVLENMWEPEPMLIGDLVDLVNSPHLRACVDVGHVYLYSKLSLDEWLASLDARLAYVHMNNNPGTNDEHRALGDGALDYHMILPKLRQHVSHPLFSLEIDNVEAIRRSLSYLDLPPPNPDPVPDAG